MKVKKILVGFDASQSSYKALGVALDLAHPLQSSLDTLTIIHLPDFSPTMDELEESMDEAKKRYEAEFKKVEQIGQERGFNINSIMQIGHPAESLIRYATDRQYDLLVVGTRGLGGFKKLLIGSVAQKVVTYSTIPVLVVHD